MAMDSTWNMATVCGIMLFFLCECFGSEIKTVHYRIDERYQDRIPQTGILWTKSDIEVRWCLYVCLRDVDCASIFFEQNTCHGYSVKLHDMISIKTVIGMKYYELAGPVGNLAAGKTAIQSSFFVTDRAFGPEYAVDSRRYPFQNELDPDLKSCSHTADLGEDDEDHSPFWQVDLGSRHLVLSVSFLSRIECCGERNQRLNITVAETANGPRALCMYYPGPAFVGEMKTFFCEKPLFGQFVRTSRDRVNLNPCEIEVYGYPLN